MMTDLLGMLSDELRELLHSYGLDCGEREASLLLGHLGLVIEKNKVVNLTRITSPSEALVLHVLDSLLPLCSEHVRMGEKDRYADMGTGAGFPGIPLGIMTGASGLLLDSVGKKVSAVNEFIGELGLSNLSAVQTRVEDLDRSLLGTFDFVFARAVAQANVLLEYATPLLGMGGRVVLEKGRPEEAEIVAADSAARLCGLIPVSRETFELPNGLGHREILIYEKHGRSRVKLPRKAGVAKREPLGM